MMILPLADAEGAADAEGGGAVEFTATGADALGVGVAVALT